MKVKVIWTGELGVQNILPLHLPTGIYQWDDVSNGSDDWAGRKYELPSGYRIHHYTMVRSSVVVYTVYTSSDSEITFAWRIHESWTRNEKSSPS